MKKLGILIVLLVLIAVGCSAEEEERPETPIEEIGEMTGMIDIIKGGCSISLKKSQISGGYFYEKEW